MYTISTYGTYTYSLYKIEQTLVKVGEDLDIEEGAIKIIRVSHFYTYFINDHNLTHVFSYYIIPLRVCSLQSIHFIFQLTLYSLHLFTDKELQDRAPLAREI
jgi:hypothetical protein